MAEGKIPRVVDVNGYVLSEEEVRLEWDLYRKAGISFLCPHCRRIVGTGDYKEFMRRRMKFEPVTHHFTRDGRLIVGQQPTEDWRKAVREIFPSCPFCDEKDLWVDIRFERPSDYVSCPSCTAKWQTTWKGEGYRLDSITLIKDSVDKKGQDFLMRTLRPEFWKDIAVNPMKEVTAQDIVREEKDLSREERERIRAENTKTLTISLAIFALGLAILGIGYEVTTADRFLMIIFILFGGVFMFSGASGLVSSTQALWYMSPKRDFDRIVRDMRKKMEKSRKRDERLERLLLVDCPKCQNHYDRFLIENCPNCGARNPRFKDIWKKDKSNTS